MTTKISTKEKFPMIVTDVRYDIEASYPTDETEVYEYSLNGTVMFTATITFSDDTKEEFVSLVWS